jgi:RimJ/RimL family protein N-acetyltransferase
VVRVSVFLRGARVTLHATDARPPVGPEAWWDAGPRAEGHDEVVMGVHDLTTPAARGVVGLTAIDWVGHHARLCGGAGGLSAVEMEEAAALVVRYAFDELNLERIDAAPTSPEALHVLGRLGFALDRREGLHALRRPRPPGTH